MTHRERVTAAFEHRQPDRVPYSVGFTERCYRQMVEYTGSDDFLKSLDNSLTGLSARLPRGYFEVRPNVLQDEFGVQWDKSVDKDIGVVCNQMVTKSTLDDYEFPDPDAEERWASCEAAMADRDGKFVLVDLGFSLFERAWTLFGMENLLAAMAMDPPFVEALLDRITDFNVAIVERACSYDIDAMMFGDDWGCQRGLIMGPAMWHTYIEPRIRRMYGAARDRGKFVMIHSCGKVDELFPTLIDAGLTCFNPFQPEVMDVYEMKRLYGDRLAFFGGISTQKTLPFATPEETRAEVRRLLAEIGKDGGYIAAPAHGIPAGAKPENVLAMIEVLRDQ